MLKKTMTLALLSLLLLTCGGPASEEEASTEIQTAAEKAPASTVAYPADLPLVETDFSTDYIMGKFEPAQHSDFVRIEPAYANREGMFLRKDAYEAFTDMHKAAKADGVNLKIISATRNFQAQKGIWEAKWTGSRQVGGKDLSQTIPVPKERALKILEYSSMPGTSRHHWGTDIDLNNLNNSYFRDGEGKKIYDWLQAHAAEYGFCQPYSEKGADRPDGYNEEKWHWSYMPVAQPLTKMAREELKNDMIEGFKGAKTAGQIDVVQKYVLGINPDCM